MSKNINRDLEAQLLEERKVQALEKIAKTLDNLTLWFEEIDTDEWGERMQYYLAEFLSRTPKVVKQDIDEEEL